VIKYLVSIVTVFTIGCGFKIGVDPVEVEPITVNHKVSVDSAQLLSFYTEYCEGKYTEQDEIDECVTESLALFWEAFNSSSQSSESD
jgi:hypothetical protein